MDLKTRRISQGLSLSELSRKVGIDPAHLHQIENHRMNVSDKIAVKVAAVLGVGPKTLQEEQSVAAVKYNADKIERMGLETVKRVAAKNPKRAALVVIGLKELMEDDSLPLEMRKAAGKAAEKLIKAASKSAFDPKPLPYDRIERDAQGKRLKEYKTIRRDPHGRRLGKDAYGNLERDQRGYRRKGE